MMKMKMKMQIPEISSPSPMTKSLPMSIPLPNFIETIIVSLPPSNKKFLAFYNTFSNQKNAEYELLQRLQKVCQKLGIGFLLISNKNIVENPDSNRQGMHIDSFDTNEIICVISLHYLSGKTSKHFTLLTLWNPLGYHNSKDFNRMHSFDGYISAYSDSIDFFVKSHYVNKPFLGHLNTTLDSPLLDIMTSFSNLTCFYVGVNWDQQSRLSLYRKKVIDLVKALDHLRIISLYGPQTAWPGYASYVSEIVFDGESIIHEIRRSGICLVLSSELHILDTVCSNRLFEGLAAGVPILSDRNPFIEKWFGDSIFFIDTFSVDVAVKQIQQHMTYIQNHPEETIQKIQRAREIFTGNFLMSNQLANVIASVKSHRHL